MLSSRSILSVVLFIFILGCNQGGEDARTVQSHDPEPSNEITLNNNRLKAAFDREFYRFYKDNRIQLNVCYSYKDKVLKPGKCRATSIGSKRIKASPVWIEGITDFKYDPEHFQIDVIADVAIVKFDALWQSGVTRSTATDKCKGTMEFVRENGEWKIVHEHLLAWNRVEK